MAKLSAYGQVEVVRCVGPREAGDGDLTVGEQASYAVMDNGRMLKRHVCWFKPTSWEPEPRRHDYGWKVVGAASKARLDKVMPWTQRLAAEGWTVAWGPAQGLARAAALAEGRGA